MNTKQLLKDATGFAVKLGGKTISGLSLEEANEILKIPTPIVTVQKSNGRYFPIVRFGNREFTSAAFSNWRDCNNAAHAMADRVLQNEIERILGA